MKSIFFSFYIGFSIFFYDVFCISLLWVWFINAIIVAHKYISDPKGDINLYFLNHVDFFNLSSQHHQWMDSFPLLLKVIIFLLLHITARNGTWMRTREFSRHLGVGSWGWARGRWNVYLLFYFFNINCGFCTNIIFVLVSVTLNFVDW